MKITLLCTVTPCSLIHKCQNFSKQLIISVSRKGPKGQKGAGPSETVPIILSGVASSNTVRAMHDRYLLVGFRRE